MSDSIINIASDFNGSVNQENNLTGNGEFVVDKNLSSPSEVLITITSVQSGRVKITNICPSQENVTVIMLVVNGADDANKSIINRYKWSDAGLLSTQNTYHSKTDIFNRSGVTRREEITDTAGINAIPSRGSDILISSLENSNTSGSFSENDKLGYVISADTLTNEQIESQAIYPEISTSIVGTTKENTIQFNFNSNGAEKLYLIWYYKGVPTTTTTTVPATTTTTTADPATTTTTTADPATTTTTTADPATTTTTTTDPATTTTTITPLNSVNLEYGSGSCANVCSNYGTGSNNSGTFYLDVGVFAIASILYTNPEGTNTASANFYSDGTICRPTDGSGNLGVETPCSIPTTTTTTTTSTTTTNAQGGFTLEYGSGSCENVCSNYGTGVNNSGIFYTDVGVFDIGNILYTDAARTQIAVSGFYSNGSTCRPVDGSGNLGTTSSC